MFPDVIQVVVDGRVHCEACGFPNSSRAGREQEAGLEGIEFDGFRAGSLQEILELGDRLSPAFPPSYHSR